jgi:hypothetical protein
MVRNTVTVLASTIVARLRVAMPELHAAITSSRQPARPRRRAPHQASGSASAGACGLSPHFAAASGQFPHEMAETIAAEILSQLGLAAERADLPLEKIEI